MVVVGGLVLGALLAALFVRHPPDYVIGHVSAAQLGAAASRQNDLALLLRTIYALAFVPVLIAAVASSWERIRFFADAWVVSTVICALAAILDHFAHAGIGNALVTGPLPTDRAVGLTDQPNYLGQFTAMALPVAIVRTYQLKGSGRVAYLGATGVLIIALQLSGSRLGLLGALVAVGFLAALVPRVRKGILLGGIVLSVLGAGLLVYQPAGHSVLERFSGDPAATNADNVRRYVLERTWDIARDHLPTGVGFSRILDSHSLVIQFLLAGGVVALAAFCIWVWGMCRLGVTVALSDRAPPEGAQLAAALTAALLAWLVPGIVNPQLLERFMYVPAGLLLAMGYCLARSPAWSAAIEGAKSSWASAVSADPARREPILATIPREGHP
jgi:hypothetical protein